MKKPRRTSRTPERPPTLEARLAQRRRAVLTAVVLLSAAIRFVYFQQLNATPLVELHRLDQTDMNFYESWGRTIAAGDRRSATVMMPMHGWHREVATQYFAAHPDERPALEQEAARLGDGSDADSRLWARWIPDRSFYQDPLYAYLIGTTYTVAGVDVRGVFVWQMALGIGTNVLIWLLARRFFGDVVALVAAALAMLCGPLVYYDLVLLRETTIVFMTLAVAWLIDRAFAGDGRGAAFVALGAACGLALLLKSSLALAIVPVVVALAMRARTMGARALRFAGAFVAAVALAVAPIVVRNILVGVAPLSLASSGTLTFVAANDVGYPVEAGFEINPPQLARVLGDTHGRFVPAAVETLRAHTIGSFAALLWHKWDRIWHWVEIPNNEDFYYMRAEVPILRWLPVTAWILAPLSLAGLAIGWPRRRDAWPLYAIAACSIAPMLVFYVLGRFRVVLLATLIPFAALAVVEWLRWLRARRWMQAAGVAAAVGASLVWWTGRPPAPTQPLIRAADWLAPYLIEYRDEIRRGQDVGDVQRTFAAFEGVFRFGPAPAQLTASGDREIAGFFGRMHADYAALLRQAGRPAEAETQMLFADQFFVVASKH